VADPLAEASKHVRQMLQFCGERIDTHLLAAQLFLRKGTFLISSRVIRFFVVTLCVAASFIRPTCLSSSHQYL
jgi:hypothetical protein